MIDPSRSIPGNLCTQRNLVLLLLLVIAAVAFYRTPYSASNLDVVPDSVEYSVAASRLVSEGRYEITINGQPYPPRYPPWFSALFLVPVYYALGPEELGNAIIPLVGIALLGIGMAYNLGRRLSGDWGGLLAGLCLTFLPTYHFYSRQIMTDVPCTVLALIGGLLYLKLQEGDGYKTVLLAAAGCTIALATALRPTSFFLVVPFLWVSVKSANWQRAISSTVLLAAPLGGVFLVNALYHLFTFGEPFRTGYHFWCPWPYEFPAWVFSFQYLSLNYRALSQSGVPALLALTFLFLVIQRRLRSFLPGSQSTIRAIGFYALLGIGPIVILHMIYFFSSVRFFLLPAAFSLVLLAGAIGLMLVRVPKPAGLILLLGALYIIVSFRWTVPDRTPDRRLAVDQMLLQTTRESLIISLVDPVYLDHYLSTQDGRQVLPLSRRVEYASKLIAPQRIRALDRIPDQWNDHRFDRLREAGAVEVIPMVAVDPEGILFIEKSIQNGRKVFLDTSLASESDLDAVNRIKSRFKLRSEGGNLFRVLELAP